MWSLVVRLGPASPLGISYGPDCRGCFAGAMTGVDLRSAALVAECGGVAALVRALQTYGNDTAAELDGINVAEQVVMTNMVAATDGQSASLVIAHVRGITDLTVITNMPGCH